MSDGLIQERLGKAKKAFDAHDYKEAADVLISIHSEDMKVLHNYAIVKYLLREADSEKTLSILKGSDVGEEETKSAGNQLFLQYEGHETAIYNRAAILAHSGRPHEAVRVLRGLIDMGNNISLSVLTHALCLFQILTRPMTNLGCRPRSRADEELVQAVLAAHMENITKDAALRNLVTTAFADSSNVLEGFNTSNPTTAEQAVLLNNLGILSLNDGRPHVATLYFAKAQKAAMEQPHAHAVHQTITYNRGLCALLREDYNEAIHHFLTVQNTMKTSPLFWVRLAEAAVELLQSQCQLRRQEQYEAQQDAFSGSLHAGRVYPNMDFMLLPGAVATPVLVQEPLKDSSASTAVEQLAAGAVQNALFLLIPQRSGFTSIIDSLTEQEQLLEYAMLYWCALELFCSNYVVAVDVGQQLLSVHERRPLPANLHATLLSYVVEALIHLNEPERAMKTLRRASLSALITGSSSDHLDVVQRSRVEALFVNVAVTHILNGSWNQAHATVDCLLTKLYDTAPSGSSDYKPARDVMFAYQILGAFLELAQGNQEKAAEWLSKANWSI